MYISEKLHNIIKAEVLKALNEFKETYTDNQWKTWVRNAKKCGDISKFKKTYPTVYKKILNLGMLPNFKADCRFSNKNRLKIYPDDFSYEQCLKMVSKYPSKFDFYIENQSLYAKCVRNGWLEQIYNDLGWEKIERDYTRYTFDDCMEAASNCMSLNEFRTKYPKHYNRARNKKWINDIIEIMSWDYDDPAHYDSYTGDYLLDNNEKEDY